MAGMSSGIPCRASFAALPGARTVALVLSLLAAAPASPTERTVRGLALVNGDASLTVAGERIALAGIHLPDAGRTCDPRFRPVPCGPRAVLELRRLVHGFVECRITGRRPDGTATGFCRVGRDTFSEGDDVGLRLVARGLALALPDAPFAYRAAERIARAARRGVWAFAEDP